MTVGGTPLPGLPIGGITPPWKVVPAHVVIHAAVFVGTVLTLMLADRSFGIFRLVGGPPEGMTTVQWVTWLIVGLGSAPVMATSYGMARIGGRTRYLALWVHIIANFMAAAAISIYLYAAAAVGGLLPGWAFGWSVIFGVIVFIGWLLVNDSLRLRQLERLATRLEKTQVAVDRAEERSKALEQQPSSSDGSHQ